MACVLTPTAPSRPFITQPRLRFLLADGAGAGKTIMAGLYIREMQARRLCSVDTLAGESMFAQLQGPEVEPYDLVIFDEAHKLAASRDADLTVDKTDRYMLGEALAGGALADPRWALPWSARHLLLLTATPHMGGLPVLRAVATART